MDESKHAPIADDPHYTRDDLPKPHSPIVAVKQTDIGEPPAPVIFREMGAGGVLTASAPSIAVPLSEPSVEPQGAEATTDGSPLSVHAHMARMIITHGALTAEVARLKEASDAALALWRAKRDELEETTRILRAYERIRSPKRRKQP